MPNFDSEMRTFARSPLATHEPVVDLPEKDTCHHNTQSPLDLTTTYLGFELRNPLVASAGPLTHNVDGVIRLADAGCGAVVLHSLFEEQIATEHPWGTVSTGHGMPSSLHAHAYLPMDDVRDDNVQHYLDLIEAATQSMDVPLIANLNCATLSGWTEMAQRMTEAGASAIELTIYFIPGSWPMSGKETEERHLEIVQAVKSVVDVPVAVKLNPYFSSTGAMALALDEAGVDGLVLFNRFLSPDVDVESMSMRTGFELSRSSEGALARTWIASLHGKVKASLAGSTGVENADDIVRYLMAGADVVMTTSALVRNGIDYASVLVDGLEDYLNRTSLTLCQVRGMASTPTPSGVDNYARLGYVVALEKTKTLNFNDDK